MKSLYRSFSSSIVRLAAVLTLLVALPATGSFAAIAYAHHHAPVSHVTSTHAISASGMFFTPNSQWSTTAQNDRLAAINSDAATGFLDIYGGTMPANANASLSGTTLLCSIPLGSTAFHAPSGGAMTNNGALSCTASASATATFEVLFKSNHTTVLYEGNAGTSGANLNLATTTITSGITINVADAAITITDNASITGQ